MKLFSREDKENFLEEIDNIKQGYINKAAEVPNSFCSSFYSLLAEFSAIDAADCFCGSMCRSNGFRKCTKNMDGERERRFFNIVAMHHTIQMLAKKRDKLDFYTVSICFYNIYDIGEGERELFEILYKYRMDFPKQFPAVFSRTAVKYIFGNNDSNIFFVAFFQNFCYNSFKTFLSYFSKYISINRRIKIYEMNKAAEA